MLLKNKKQEEMRNYLISCGFEEYSTATRSGFAKRCEKDIGLNERFYFGTIYFDIDDGEICKTALYQCCSRLVVMSSLTMEDIASEMKQYEDKLQEIYLHY